jgi:hypothetical protein
VAGCEEPAPRQLYVRHALRPAARTVRLAMAEAY